MSDVEKRPIRDAILIARAVMYLLEHTCSRIEFAGSLRREKPLIGDIEIVAIPILPTDLFGKPVFNLPTPLDILLECGGYTMIKNGKKMKQFLYADMTVDLFLQPDPATWGVNFMIRTGSADFSRWMVTRRLYGGGLPNDMKFLEGRLWKGNVMLDTPEEQDVFQAMGLAYIDPYSRGHAPDSPLSAQVDAGGS